MHRPAQLQTFRVFTSILHSPDSLLYHCAGSAAPIKSHNFLVAIVRLPTCDALCDRWPFGIPYAILTFPKLDDKRALERPIEYVAC
jgi:hypothetical protein